MTHPIDVTKMRLVLTYNNRKTMLRIFKEQLSRTECKIKTSEILADAKKIGLNLQ